MYHLIAFLTMAVWGTTFVSTKVLLTNGLTPAGIFLLRFGMAYIGLSLACLIGRERRSVEKSVEGGSWMCRSWRDECMMAVAGMTGGSFYFLTENTALELALASNVSLIVCLAPLITALFALFIRKGERATPRLWLGSVMAFTGVAFVSLGSGGGEAGKSSLSGSLLALAAATLWAGYQHVVKPLATRYGTLMLTRKVFGYGVLTILPFVLFGKTAHWETLTRPVVWGNLLFLGLIASLLCYATWNAVVEKLGSIVSANYIYLDPLVTCMAAYVILGERLTPVMIFGGVAILAGLYLVVAPRRKGHGKAEKCTAVVFYRLPGKDICTSMRQHTPVKTFSAIDKLPMGGGYVVAPFAVSEKSPIVLVEPDVTWENLVKKPETGDFTAVSDDGEQQRTDYARAFSSAHGRLKGGVLKKIVLSRRLHVRISSTQNDVTALGESLFYKACVMRPECFVAFWWTQQTGAWLVATPEPILEHGESHWETVALAGTAPFREGEATEWSGKNREEQAIVSRFVANVLQGVARHVRKSDTITFRTGSIQHLCTKFKFNLISPQSVPTLLKRLHPTPAVCGFPRKEATEAIAEDESSPRRYYACFSGPLFFHGETHLFVTLRCMELSPQTATLYAGGGIMPHSDEQEEWEETQRKLSTMRALLFSEKNKDKKQEKPAQDNSQ